MKRICPFLTFQGSRASQGTHHDDMIMISNRTFTTLNGATAMYLNVDVDTLDKGNPEYKNREGNIQAFSLIRINCMRLSNKRLVCYNGDG